MNAISQLLNKEDIELLEELRNEKGNKQNFLFSSLLLKFFYNSLAMFATILKLFWHSFGILLRSFRNSFPILFRFSCNLFAQKNTHDVAKTQHTWCCNYFAQFCAIIGNCHRVYLPGLYKQLFSFFNNFLVFFLHSSFWNKKSLKVFRCFPLRFFIWLISQFSRRLSLSRLRHPANKHFESEMESTDNWKMNLGWFVQLPWDRFISDAETQSQRNVLLWRGTVFHVSTI